MSKLRRNTYKAAAVLGDIESLESPEKLAKRQVRKRLYRKNGSLMRALCKAVGL